jgi:hypothetical protein
VVAKSNANPAKWRAGGDGKTPLMRSPDAVPEVRRPMTEERKSKFLEALKKFGSIQKAAEAVDGNINTRRSFMGAIAKDPAFGRAAEDAMAAYSEKIADVLRQEFFEGTMVPVVNKDGIVLDKDGNEVWIRKRDPKIVLALAKKHDFGLREIKTTVNVDASNPLADNPDDPRVYVASSDLLRLEPDEVQTLTDLLRKVHRNRAESFLDITPPQRDQLDAEDVSYTVETSSVADAENPFGI